MGAMGNTFLKTASAALAGQALQQAPTGVLLGVNDAAQAALASLNIVSVFDLAASGLFEVARRLLALETDATLFEARQGTMPADAVNLPPPGIPLQLWARQPIGILKGIAPALVGPVSAALDVSTVRDLALWPPGVAARALLQGVLLPASFDDSEIPPELLPASGVYPVERVSLRKLVIDAAPSPGATPLEQQADAVDLTSVLGSSPGFDRLATGALLTFSQSWFAQGLSLGHLLHSLSLAPGETTRIAVVDWSRQSRGRSGETVSQSEALSNSLQHTRALSEVTDATVREFQSGQSRTSVDATTLQAGGGGGLDLGIVAFGASASTSDTHTEAVGVSSSFGTRDLAARFGQQVNDLSQQTASAARSRRASVVRELSQSERETLSSRVVTNYNHMHALNLQYHEVVQVFRVTTQLERAERCLFVPLKLLDFSNTEVVDRQRGVLAAVALSDIVRQQLTRDYGVVELVPQVARVTPATVATTGLGTTLNPAVVGAGGAGAGSGGGAGGAALAGGAGGAGGVTTLPFNPSSATATAATAAAAATTAGTATATAAVTPKALRFDLGPARAAATLVARRGFDMAQVSRLAALAGQPALRDGSDGVFVPDESRLIGLQLLSGAVANLVVLARTGAQLPAQLRSATQLSLATPARLADLQSVVLQLRPEDAVLNATLRLQFDVQGTVLPLDIPLALKAAGASLQAAVVFNAVRAAPELLRHLQANRLHYSQAVFARLDASAVAGLLGRLTLRGQALGTWVEPQPLQVVGNSLVFRMTLPLTGVADNPAMAQEMAAWQQFLTSRGLNAPTPQTDTVPLPTGGVFAEAVLGRFNSAEKIDLTRFWNWQDSPIQISAPDIAALSPASRRQAQDLMPGAFGSPLLQQQAPTTLPGAAGVQPLLTALQNGNLFRDMSGLAQVSALAQSATDLSGSGATSAGAQAAANLKTTMEEHTARMRIAAELSGATQGGGQGTLTARAAVDKAVSDAATSAAASGASAGGSGVAAGGSQPTLFQRTAEALSGSAVAGVTQGLVDDAVAGIAGEAAGAGQTRSARVARQQPTQRPALPPSTGILAGSAASGAGVFGNAPNAASAAADDSPRRFRITVSFLPSQGVLPPGFRSMRLDSEDGSLLTEAAAADSPDTLTTGFSSAELPAKLRVGMFFITPQLHLEMREEKAVLVPPSEAGVITRLRFEVRPTLRSVTIRIKARVALPALLEPDTADLDAQMLHRGIGRVELAKEPSFKLAPDLPPRFDATLLIYTGKATVRQIV